MKTKTIDQLIKELGIKRIKEKTVTGDQFEEYLKIQARKSITDNKVLFFLDTEFTGLEQDAELISIGITTLVNNKPGPEFYAEITDFNKDKASDWVKENVFPGLPFANKKAPYIEFGLGRENIFEVVEESYDVTIDDAMIKSTKKETSNHLRSFINLFKPLNKSNKIEVWSDCLAYDWVLFCDLLDNNLPDNILYIPFDICTVFKMKGIDPDISREAFIGNQVEGYKHNALYDAIVIKKCFEKLMSI